MKILEEEMKRIPADEFDPKLQSLISSSDIYSTWQRMTLAERREVVSVIFRRIVIMPRNLDWNNGKGYDVRRVKFEWAWDAQQSDGVIPTSKRQPPKRKQATKVRMSASK